MRRAAKISAYQWVAAVAMALAYILVAWSTVTWVRQAAIDDLIEAGRRQLNLYVTHLQGQLGKYEFLPQLISTNPRLVELLSTLPDAERIQALNRYLEEVNLISDASDTYMMDSEGLTVAASNWESERPIVGRSFSYRPYFQQAMQGRAGRYFALGTTSRKRGYYFAYPVRHEGRILGAVVTKVDIGEIESQWAGRDEEVVVTDPDGIIFITTRANWRFRTLEPLTGEVRERVTASRRYPGERLEALDIGERRPIDDRTSRLEIRSVQAPNEGAADDVRYLIQNQAMPEAGWRLHLLTPMRPVDRQGLEALATATLACFSLAFLPGVSQLRSVSELQTSRGSARFQGALRRGTASCLRQARTARPGAYPRPE